MPSRLSVHTCPGPPKHQLNQVSQTDARVGSIEVKIKKLDGELGRYKEQMSKLRNGPGKVHVAHYASLGTINTSCRPGCDTAARIEGSEAETDV